MKQLDSAKFVANHWTLLLAQPLPPLSLGNKLSLFLSLPGYRRSSLLTDEGEGRGERGEGGFESESSAESEPTEFLFRKTN